LDIASVFDTPSVYTDVILCVKQSTWIHRAVLSTAVCLKLNRSETGGWKTLHWTATDVWHGKWRN